jgi:pimeloyl-ACP methyl ester carboxylesterase
MIELYRSDQLLVRMNAPHGSTRLVVTFAPWRHDPGVDRPGFGDAFCEAHGLDAIHVTCAGNDWYQYPDMAAAYSAIRKAARPYGNVVTYGVSMGGYQAIKAARHLDARRVLAISPQSSVDPARVPFETRWPEAAALTFIDDKIKPWPGARYALVYDPRNPLDAAHAAAITQRLRKRQPHLHLQQVPMPFLNHNILQSWKEVGLISRAVLTLMKSKKDAGGVRGLFRNARRGSARYLEGVLATGRLRGAVLTDAMARLESLRAAEAD